MKINQLSTEITLDQLERTSINWDKRTRTILLHVSGAGNMFGGNGMGYAITLHGENSILPTGQIDIDGIWSSGYNVARGLNGGNAGYVSYWKGIGSLNAIGDNRPDFKISVEGSCNTGTDTLCSILGASPDWLKSL